MKPNFSTLGSIVELSPQIPILIFLFDDSIRDLLGVNAKTLYTLSPNRVDILSFDIIFIHIDITEGMIFRGKMSEIIHILTMDVDPGYKCIENFRGGIQWYMMESKDIISSIRLKLKK